MEKPAPIPAPIRAMATRTLRSASQATGTVPSRAADPARATISRISASDRWKASRTFGMSTLNALWVA